MSAEVVAAHIFLRGRVQNVGFRYFVQDISTTLAVKGWVRNLPDSHTVEAYGEAPRETLEKWLDHLKKGPPGARVEDSRIDWPPPLRTHQTFSIAF